MNPRAKSDMLFTVAVFGLSAALLATILGWAMALTWMALALAFAAVVLYWRWVLLRLRRWWRRASDQEGQE